jgi:DNA-binding winged helix-turn-helix (wHTH) protein
MFWIINDRIKFHPEKNTLASVSKPELSVIITAPASRCLTLLLESWPNVVTQKELFTFVWAEDGMLVPTNTLYQNISIIRRGLRTVGEADETLVSTVPRKGFQIDSSVKVTRVATEEEAPEQQFVDSSPVEALIPEPEMTENALPASVAKAGTDTVNRKWVQNSRIALLLLLSFGLGLSMFHLPWTPHSERDFFNDYTIIRNENECHFVSQNDDIKKTGGFTKAKNTILQTGLDCKKYPWIYFLSSSTAPALSALICREPFETSENSRCVTLYFRWKN